MVLSSLSSSYRRFSIPVFLWLIVYLHLQRPMGSPSTRKTYLLSVSIAFILAITYHYSYSNRDPFSPSSSPIYLSSLTLKSSLDLFFLLAFKVKAMLRSLFEGPLCSSPRDLFQLFPVALVYPYLCSPVGRPSPDSLSVIFHKCHISPDFLFLAVQFQAPERSFPTTALACEDSRLSPSRL